MNYKHGTLQRALARRSFDPALNMATVQHLVQASEIIAKANHYMVGITWTAMADPELDAAYQLLIDMQNEIRQGTARWKALDRALDLIEGIRAGRREKGVWNLDSKKS